MYTQEENVLYEFMYSYINKVLNVDKKLDIIIVQSHQNIPKQIKEDGDPFISIGYAPNTSQKTGTSYTTEIDDSGVTENIDDFNNVMEVREVNGNGNLLKMIVRSIGKQENKEYWKSNGFAYMSEGEIISIPVAPENRMKKESMVEITINNAESDREDTGFIKKTEYEGTIPAQGRSGDHTIQDTIDAT
jgi:hypothetical protein